MWGIWSGGGIDCYSIYIMGEIMETQEVKIKSWNRFLTTGLAVKPEIMGAEHRFPFHNSLVTIKIPSIDQIDRGKGYDEVVSVSWRRAVDNEPLEYDIHKVDVEVSIPIITSIPSEVLNRNANAYEILSDEEQKKLNQIATQHESIAEEAFEYWLRVLRWIKDDSRIGRRQVEKLVNWNVRLFDEESAHKIWVGGGVFHVERYKTIESDEWQEIQSKLESKSQPPIFIELKHDANENIKLGDFRRAVIDMAMACETFMRFSVLQRLPNELNLKLVEYIEMAGVNQYIDRFFPETIDENGNNKFKTLKSDLTKLFKKRNKLVHMGQDNGIDETLCQTFLGVTEELLSINSLPYKHE